MAERFQSQFEEVEAERCRLKTELEEEIDYLIAQRDKKAVSFESKNHSFLSSKIFHNFAMGKFFKRKSFKKWKSFLDLDRLRQQQREPDGLPVSLHARVQMHGFHARGRF